jgi:DNA-binding beta-propeller fold protein YncE
VTAAEGSAEVIARRGRVALTPNQQTKVASDGKPKAPVTVNAAAMTSWTSRLTWTVLAQLGQDEPTKLALDAQGNLYVTEEYQGRVLKLSPTGKILASWGSQGTDTDQFAQPRGIAVDAAGNVYVTDAKNDDIVKLSSSGQPLAVWGGYGSDPGQFNFPSGIAVDPAGDVYVADTGNFRIQKLSPSGEPLAEWGEAGLNRGQFKNPEGVALDAAGNIYVADWGAADFVDRIIKLSPSGTFLAQWGGKQGSDIGQFNTPSDIAADPAGTLYVAETGNARIQELLAADGRSLGILGTHGSAAGQFDFGDPTGVAVDRDGNLYTAEEGTHRIEKYTP